MCGNTHEVMTYKIAAKLTYLLTYLLTYMHGAWRRHTVPKEGLASMLLCTARQEHSEAVLPLFGSGHVILSMELIGSYETMSNPTLDSCCPNSSNFCCSGVLSDSVSDISVLILPATTAAAAAACSHCNHENLSWGHSKITSHWEGEGEGHG